MKYLISDSHTDFLTEIINRKKRERYIKFCAKCGIKYLCCAIFTTDKNYNTHDIQYFKEELQFLSKKYNICLLLTIEDLGFIKSSQELEEIVKIKPFSVTLTWNQANQFAGGANSNLGLTSLGKNTIRLLENNGILVDTAHLSRKAFFEFTEVTKRPIFNSHTNINTLLLHPRNLNDKQIQLITNSNGFMGLSFYQKFISDSTITSANIANQFEYLSNKFGYQYFGFGSDLWGFQNIFKPKDIKTYRHVPKIISKLKKLQFKEHEILGISYKNFENFLNRINIIKNR